MKRQQRQDAERIPTRAILWARISEDKAGDEHGVNNQINALKKFAARNLPGWGFGPDSTHLVIENDRSGYKRDYKVWDSRLRCDTYRTNRPQLWEIIRMLRSGEADGILVRDVRRASRDPKDMEELIEAFTEWPDKQGIPRPVARSIEGDMKLGNASDILMARFQTAMARGESGQQGLHVSMALSASVDAGKIVGLGPRPWGYDRIRADDGKAQLVPRSMNPDGTFKKDSEAYWFRWAADAVLAGKPLGYVCLIINRQECMDPKVAGRNLVRHYDKGAYWTYSKVRSILLKPRMAGILMWKGEVIRKDAWPAIIPEATWLAMCKVLENPNPSGAKRGPQPGVARPRHLGTGIYLCGLCLEKDRTAEQVLRGCAGEYYCPRCGFRVRKEYRDKMVISKIINVLKRPETEELAREPEPSQQLDRLYQEKQDLQDELAEVRASRDAHRLPLEEYEYEATRLWAGINRIKTQIASAQTRTHRAIGKLAGKPDAGQIWNTLELEEQREIISDVCRVTVKESRFRPNQWHSSDPESVCIEFRSWLAAA